MIPSQLPLFLAVVNAGSFSGAARSLGISPAAVSKAIAQMEKTLQVRLFHRTTHALTLTAEGQDLHQRVEPLWTRLEDEVRISTDTQQALSGRIKVNLPNSFGTEVVMPLLTAFMQQYPQVQMDLYFDDKVQDIVENGFDISIGTRIDEDSRLIARRFHDIRLLTVCSPQYAAAHGIPAVPEDLRQHRCIGYRAPTAGTVFPWPYRVNDERITIPAQSSLTCTSPVATQQAARAHLGLAMAADHNVQDGLENGELIQVLADFEPEPLTVWLYYSSRRYLPARVRLLIDFLMSPPKQKGLLEKQATP